MAARTVVIGVVFAFATVSRGAEVFLTRDGAPAATIVTADAPLPACDNRNPAATQATAAAEIQRYVEKASGARLPIVPAAGAPASGTLLLVGRSALTERYGLRPPDRPEGFRIVSFPRGVAVLGEVADPRRPENNTEKELDRGIMHAAYAFLERCVGCRFFFDSPGDPDLGTTVPSRRTIGVSVPLDYADAPVFTHRESWQVSLAATRRGSADRFNPGHTHGAAWERRYRESHPEYFMLKPDGSRNFGFLCYSEPGVLEAELRHIEEWYGSGSNAGGFETRPTVRYIPVWPDDLYPAQGCACPRCRAKRKPGYDGAWSNMWWDYVRRLAVEVGKRWPEKRVAAGAYTTWLLPPDFSLPENVCVQLCIHPGGEQSHAHTFMNKQPEIYAKNLSLVAAWSAKLGNDPSRLHLREYGLADSHTGMPVLYPNVLQRWLRDIRPLCKGVYFDGIYGAGNTPMTALMTWLQFRLLWNPDLDVRGALRDYCRDFFGPAATPMEELYGLLIQRYEEPWPPAEVRGLTGLGFSIGMLFGRTYPPDALDRIEGCLRAAAVAAGLPADPEWSVRSDSAWVVPNPGDAPRACAVSFAPAGCAVANPTLRWAGGELSYRGVLSDGQRLVVEPGPKARLIEADGTTRDAAARLRGGPPVIPPRTTAVVHYSSRQADERDLVRVAVGPVAPPAAATAASGVHQRRVQWLRRHFEVHTMGLGRYVSPEGPLALGRMTQMWTARGTPVCRVGPAAAPPGTDWNAPEWRSAATVDLVRGGTNPQNADVNVGFPAGQPTRVRLLQDERNLYVLFRCTQYDEPSNENDGVVVRLYRGLDTPVVEVAVRPDGTLYPPPPFNPWRPNYGLDASGITARAAREYPPVRTVAVRATKAATVVRETRANPGTAGRGLCAGHMPGAKGLVPYESYVGFDIPAPGADERIVRAVFRAYLRDYLSDTYPTGTLVSYSADDDWDAAAAVFPRLPALEEPAAARREGAAGERGRGWFAADVSRHLRRPGEGPGRPLTLGITAAPYQGMRGFALAADATGDLAPRIDLEIGRADVVADPWWSVLIAIPKEKLAAAGTLSELRADFARIRGTEYHQWTPALSYIWTYRFPPERRGRLLFGTAQ